MSVAVASWDGGKLQRAVAVALELRSCLFGVLEPIWSKQALEVQELQELYDFGACRTPARAKQLSP